ncbi:MAG TPA: hypothetical protein VGI19_07570 [Candidatus Cybelea sp.]|jgi:hypothetical protein
MRIAAPINFALGGAVLALFAGCSGSGLGTTAPASFAGSTPVKGFTTPSLVQTGGATAFISDYYNSVVYVLNERAAVTATLTGFMHPGSMATDKNGNLYVVNHGASNEILELAPPYTSVTKTYSDPDGFALDVAVDGSGDVAVTNRDGTQHYGIGNVIFYSAGSTTPTGMASSTGFPKPYFGAFDKRGTFFFDDRVGGGTNIGAVRHGEIKNMNAPIVPLTMANPIVFPGSVHVSTAGDLAIGDPMSAGGPVIYTYAMPTDGNLGSPISTTPLPGSSADFAFASRSHLVLTNNGGGDIVYLFRYPSGGAPLKNVTMPGNAAGEAVLPNGRFILH